MSSKKVRYLVFDVESVADGDLISTVRYPGENIDGEAAIERYRKELLDKYASDFIPYTFQIPVSVAIAKLDKDLGLIDVVTLDEPEYRPHVITENFWRGWVGYNKPTLVSFNGRSFDVPLLELAAFRYGISVGQWFNLSDRAYDQHRNRYNTSSHFDLQDLMTNFSASKFTGGLNLAANILGKPGKMGIAGHMVQDLFDEGQVERINDYCRCDVLDTYFVFLRAAVMIGQIDLAQEQEIVSQSRAWLEARMVDTPVYADYLANAGDWHNPWQQPEEANAD